VLWAAKINDKPADGMLTPEFGSLQTPPAKPQPEFALGISLDTAQAAG
jgi:hypothetical protein